MSFEIVACMVSHDALTYKYLKPIAQHPLVSRLWIVRPRKSEFGKIPKAKYVIADGPTVAIRCCKMLHECVRLGRRNDVAGFVGFGAIPYAMLGMVAATLCRKPAHLGFIGSDWYKHARSSWGRLLLRYLVRADFVTATGTDMREQMVESGFPPERVTVMPHTVDIDRFEIAEKPYEYDFIFVGELIRRKRVAVILQAMAQVLQQHPTSRLCIVGDGPEKDSLCRLAERLNITGNVDFAGYTTDVESYMSQARSVVMASVREGFPFALVEGICSGLVPITTPVGTIRDHIDDEKNGLLVPRDDVDALAGAMMRIVEDDDALYERLRSNVLRMRDQFSYDRATEVWDEWLRTLD